MAWAGVVNGKIGLLSHLFRSVKSTQIRTEPLGFRTTTRGLQVGEGREMGVIMPAFKSLSNSLSSSPLSESATVLAEVVGRNWGLSSKCRVHGKLGIMGCLMVSEKVSENSFSNSFLIVSS